MIGAHPLHRQRLQTAATTIATAATAGTPATLHFDPDGLRLVGAGPVLDWAEPADHIVVVAPSVYRDEDDLRDLAAHRLRKAAWVHGNRTLRWPSFTATDFDRGTGLVMSAARRQRCPSPWVCLRLEDLTEADLEAEQRGEHLLWVPLEDFSADYEQAYTRAVVLLTGTLATLPDPARLPLAA